MQLKDFTRGLVDFPSLRDGRVVLLCWQLDEGDTVEWWHDVDAGFAGRTPLSEPPGQPRLPRPSIGQPQPLLYFLVDQLK